MMMSARQIELAKAYCVAVGKDPEEMVQGYLEHEREVHPRWKGMIGAHPGLAEGALELSPLQKALRKSGAIRR